MPSWAHRGVCKFHRLSLNGNCPLSITYPHKTIFITVLFFLFTKFMGVVFGGFSTRWQASGRQVPILLMYPGGVWDT
jgi:hypothetical protein